MSNFRKQVRGRDGRKHKGKDCAVCGKHAIVTISHHAPELSEIEKFIKLGLGLKLGVFTPSYKTVRLCPNHHAYLHFALRTSGGTGWDDMEWQRTREFAKAHEEANMEIVTSFLIFFWQRVLRPCALSRRGWRGYEAAMLAAQRLQVDQTITIDALN